MGVRQPYMLENLVTLSEAHEVFPSSPNNSTSEDGYSSDPGGEASPESNRESHLVDVVDVDSSRRGRSNKHGMSHSALPSGGRNEYYSQGSNHGDDAELTTR